MKLDVISIVLIVFCLSVCITLFVEMTNVFSTVTAETVVIAEAH